MSFVVLKMLNNSAYRRSTDYSGHRQGHQFWKSGTTLQKGGPSGEMELGVGEAAAVVSAHGDVGGPQLGIPTVATGICHLH